MSNDKSSNNVLLTGVSFVEFVFNVALCVNMILDKLAIVFSSRKCTPMFLATTVIGRLPRKARPGNRNKRPFKTHFRNNLRLRFKNMYYIYSRPLSNH